MIRLPLAAGTTMNLRLRLVAISMLLFAGTVHAAGLSIEDPWIRAAPPGADVLAGYATLHNLGDTSLTITGGRSADFERVELHEMKMESGVMKMRPLGGIALAAHGDVALAPGGTHLMLMQPKRLLKAGDVVDVELVDASGAAHAARFVVRAAP